MTQPLHLKYRPTALDEVVGQDEICDSISAVLKSKSSQAFLLAGPSGVGKTTIARIGSSSVGCAVEDIMEIDAATYTGIDAMRNIQDTLRYKPFGESQSRAIIVDECHSLSRQAWQSLLKVVEEPPEHVYWFFCTTEPGKVPKTIKTRCTAYTLKLVSDDDLDELVNWVAEQEDMSIYQDEAVVSVIVREANGSPRQALVNLAICQNAKSKSDAARLLKSALDSDPVIELCRFLASGGSWMKAMILVSKLEDVNAESIRIQVMNYMGAAARKSKSDDKACHFLHILEQFSEPYNPSERQAPLILSIGRVLFSEA